MKTVLTHWEKWTYDVWGNRKDGYEVNDRYCLSRDYVIRLKIRVNNPGTAQEFISAYPTDYQIKKAFGVSCAIDTDGDDIVIDVKRESDWYPIGEMHCISHESLSPIREA